MTGLLLSRILQLVVGTCGRSLLMNEFSTRLAEYLVARPRVHDHGTLWPHHCRTLCTFGGEIVLAHVVRHAQQGLIALSETVRQVLLMSQQRSV